MVMGLKKLKIKKTKIKKVGVASDFQPQLSSKLAVYDIPLSRIIASAENPNEEDDRTFDQLVERIRAEGFDEPAHVMPNPDKAGHFIMVSGHHRMKAAKILKLETIPCILHEDWDETKRKIELVARNNLRGNLNPEKFTKLYDEIVKKGLDKEMVKIQMGFTKRDAFEKVYKSIEKSLPAQDKKKLKEAKENIKSVDDLSSVLNTIFKEHGSELDAGFMVFSFGGKNHHYIKVDKELDFLLTRLEKKYENGGIDEFFKEILKAQKLPIVKKSK